MNRQLPGAVLVVAAVLVAAPAIAQTTVPIGAPDRIIEHTIPMYRLDTRALRKPIDAGPGDTARDTPRNVHQPDFAYALNDLLPGGLLAEERVAADPSWPAVGATGWYPPDPDIAVGTSHVLEVVNSTIAWFDKTTGAKQFEQTAATFFSGVAQTSFIFDPKCFYDRLHGRFVVLFLEKNDASKISNALVAVSDDGDPAGTWYRYRFDTTWTDANNSSLSYWLDYPGFGYSTSAYVVSGNMFGFSSGFAGAQFVAIPVAPLLSGAAASAVRLLDAGGASVQMAEIVDAGSATAFGVSRAGASALRVYAIQSPDTASASLSSATVTVPSNSSPATDATSTGGYTLDTIDGRVFNAVWRNGRLVTAHSSTPSSGAPVAVRWYELQTGSWPAAGAPSLVQAGLVSSATTHYFTPAINKNANGDIALLFSASSSTITANVMTAGRKTSDPDGSMGTPAVARASDGSAYSQGRWGDYFGVDVDPVDDMTFWGVGEYVRAGNSWGTEVVKWTVVLTAPSTPGNLQAAASGATQINLTWADSGSETTYTVERSADNAAFSVIATLGANVTSYPNTGLTASTTYYYRVQAHNGAGDSAYSNVASATTADPAPAAPAAPTNLGAQALSSKSVRLTWTDNANNETGFTVERSTNGKSWTQVGTTGADATTFTDTSTRKRTKYSYRVRAFNAGGTSAYSNVATVTTP